MANRTAATSSRQRKYPPAKLPHDPHVAETRRRAPARKGTGANTTLGPSEVPANASLLPAEAIRPATRRRASTGPNAVAGSRATGTRGTRRRRAR